MPTSVRLDARTEKLLERLARRRSQSKSDVMRQAIESLASEDVTLTDKGTLYHSISDLLGSVRGGPSDLSEMTGKRFRRLLSRRTSRR